MGIRRFLRFTTLVVAFSFAILADESVVFAQTIDLRIMAANLSSGSYQNYNGGEGARIMQWVNPDVVMIQEFNYTGTSNTGGASTAATISSFVSNTFGSTFSYTRGTTSNNGDIPNGIISRYPILDSGEWVDPNVGNRDFVWARIDIPGPIDLYAVSVHLLTSNATDRKAEGTSLVNFLKNANLPSSAYLTIGGDFNTDTRSEAVLTTLGSVVVTNNAKFPADKSGNVNTNAGRNKPYDGVYMSANLNSKESATVIGGVSFANGFIADTRVFTPTSGLSPAFANDSGATNMQHMGVVRDFLLTVPEPGSALLIVSAGSFLFLRRRTWTA